MQQRQDEYNVLKRGLENTLQPAMQAYGLGSIPHTPLAAGLLSGKYQRDAPMPAGARMTREKRQADRWTWRGQARAGLKLPDPKGIGGNLPPWPLASRAWPIYQRDGANTTMDLGIKDKKAIVCAASKGLGKACAMSLARNGVDLVINSRTASELETTAAEIRSATGRVVTAVAADITTPEGRAKVLAACPDPDILVNNAGGPPRGDFREWDEADWMKAVNGNMITPIMLIKAVVDGMIARKFGRVVNITSGSVKSPIPELGMSNGARAGLTGFVAGLARQVAQHNVTINGLLPGPFLTDRLRSGRAEAARKAGIPVDEYIAQHFKNSPAGRPGDPFEFGEACAFLCAASSGFIVGQNLLLDGGAFNSTMG